MYMKDWKEKLDSFLKFNEKDILSDAGKVTHELAIELAEKEFDKFKEKQDHYYKSDFDDHLRLLMEERAKYGVEGNNSTVEK